MPLNCPGMYRGVIKGDGVPKTAIFSDEEVSWSCRQPLTSWRLPHYGNTSSCFNKCCVHSNFGNLLSPAEGFSIFVGTTKRSLFRNKTYFDSNRRSIPGWAGHRISWSLFGVNPIGLGRLTYNLHKEGQGSLQASWKKIKSNYVRPSIYGCPFLCLSNI